jgi:hypothetical protein
LSQSYKVICCAVALALLLQAGGGGCALSCAQAASVTNQQECRASTSNGAHAAQVVNASISTEHACCRNSRNVRLKIVRTDPFNTFHRVLEMMPCCLLASRMVIPAIRQSAAADKASSTADEKISIPPDIEFRAAPLTGRARIQDRGGTFLRCCVLLI